jgi:hypothetical protein
VGVLEDDLHPLAQRAQLALAEASDLPPFERDGSACGRDEAEQSST